MSPAEKFKNICEAYKTVWMGIVNVNPASFSSTSVSTDNLAEKTFQNAVQLIEKGAHILDIGAAPTNPQVENSVLDPQVEIDLLEPFLVRINEYLKQFTGNLKKHPSQSTEKNCEILISLDTFSPTVANYFSQKKKRLSMPFLHRGLETIQ